MAGVLDVPRRSADQNPIRAVARRLDVQGLRAIAVLIVVLDHVDIPGFSGGFVGVDVFFVISGYVITRGLLQSAGRREAGWFRDFYAKRARRLVPAATLIIAVTVVTTFELTNFIRGARILPDATSASLFLANLHFIATGTDYAMLGSDPSPLQHYWSLSIEEQFYLVWPLTIVIAMLAVARIRRIGLRQILVPILVLVIAASYLHSVVATTENGTSAYFSTFTRAWELAIGCLIAALEPSIARRLAVVPAAVIGWLGLAAIAWSVISLDADTAFPGWIAAVPVLGAAAVVVAGVSDSPYGASRVLGLAVPRYLGDISYSLYLVHWPLFTIYAARQGGDFSTTTKIVLILVAIVGAALMYHAFENPIRRSKFLAGRPWVSLAIIPLGIAIVFAVTWYERYRWVLDVPLVQQLF